MNQSISILALPKGRILESVLPLLEKTEFSLKDDPNLSRKLLLDTKTPNLKIIIIRGWDIPTYVLSGAAHFGVVGKDVLLEKHSNDYFEIADLDIAHCRISLAAPEIFNNNSSKIRVATKYPKFSSDFLATKGIQAETIYLNGSIEIAPSLGLCDAIIDLVATGKTLKENGLKEVEVIKDITSRLIVNKAALKTKNSIADELTNCLLRN
ncbi:MAG: ATP phosphoribosyltransferase [SAR86 cluster bacterium]|jgi:ATP phosphoribosyltransferase|nr:ATP phosphoribosyltransferase [SAR86 cluster bacterium]|tara:strand:+ start:21291 stop:21917 length:627 start_codon:yes stop_codon:yes gene_type:complete